MNWNFENENYSQRACGVKENVIAVSFLTAKRGVLAERTSSRGLQVDCPPHSLDWVQCSQVPGLSYCDLKPGVVGCEVLKIKKLIFFPEMDREMLCSYFPLQHPSSASIRWEPGELRLEQGPHGSQAADFTVTSLSQEALLEGAMHAKDYNLLLWSHGPESPEVSKGKQAQVLAVEGRAGKTTVPGSLQLPVEALSPWHYSLKAAKFLWERCLWST